MIICERNNLTPLPIWNLTRIFVFRGALDTCRHGAKVTQDPRMWPRSLPRRWPRTKARMPDSWLGSVTGPALHLVFLASIFDIHFKSPIVQGAAEVFSTTPNVYPRYCCSVRARPRAPVPRPRPPSRALRGRRSPRPELLRARRRALHQGHRGADRWECVTRANRVKHW